MEKTKDSNDALVKRPSLERSSSEGPAFVAAPTTFSSFAFRDFRHVWVVTLIFSMASWVQQLTVGWYAYDLTQSALFTGGVLGIRAFPYLLAAPLSGALADRLDQRRLIAFSSLAAVGLTLWFGSMITFDLVQPWHLVLFAFFGGILTAMIDPPRFVLVARSVPSSHLANAVTLTTAAFNLPRGIGPAVAGYLIAYLGVNINFFLQTALYATLVPFALAVTLAERHPARAEGPSLLRNLTQGLRYVRTHPSTFAVVLMGFVNFLFLWNFAFSVLPAYTKEVLHKGADSLGLLLAMTGAGGLLATVAFAGSQRLQPNGKLTYITALLSVASIVSLAFAPSFPVALFSMACMGFFQTGLTATNQALIQMMAGEEYRGRVISIYMVGFGLSPAGALLAGSFADTWGAEWAIFAGASIGLACLIAIAFLFPSLRRTSSHDGVVASS